MTNKHIAYCLCEILQYIGLLQYFINTVTQLIKALKKRILLHEPLANVLIADCYRDIGKRFHRKTVGKYKKIRIDYGFQHACSS